MWYQALAYIKFLLRSTNQHGVHSPFVFELVTKCFYDKTHYPEYSKLKAYRNSLLVNQTVLEITDFGTGSKVFTSNRRSIKQMAITSGTRLKRSKLLYRLVTYFHPQSVLELGTSLGIATHAMAVAQTNSKIVTIEGCPEISKFTSEQLKAFDITNVDLKSGTFAESIPSLNNDTWDLIFFDGHHDATATLKYFEQLLPTAHNASVFIFDDIHWSKDMTDAWETIKKHPQVTITIDTFYWGLVFFRTEQAKENFSIRV